MRTHYRVDLDEGSSEYFDAFDDAEGYYIHILEHAGMDCRIWEIWGEGYDFENRTLLRSSYEDDYIDEDQSY